jgi:hypothetical protein
MPASMRLATRLATRAVAALLLVVAAAAPQAEAGDITLFVARAAPSEVWSTGYGATLATNWFQVLSLEGEAARQPGALQDQTMTSFTGSAFLAPAIGRFVPYGGVGIGLYRQSDSLHSETGVLRSFALGAKVRLGLVVLRAEYRSLSLSGEPLFAMDKRVSAGAGIAF